VKNDFDEFDEIATLSATPMRRAPPPPESVSVDWWVATVSSGVCVAALAEALVFERADRRRRATLALHRGFALGTILETQSPHRWRSARETRSFHSCVLIKMIVVYCLQSEAKPSCTYVGASVDMVHRLRQHNGALVGGAKYTSKHRPWRVHMYVKDFATWRDALRFEWAWKRVSRRMSGKSAVTRREQAVSELLEKEAWRKRWAGSTPVAAILEGTSGRKGECSNASYWSGRFEDRKVR